ncbi:MAG TPA: hypothetical protein VGJ91_11860 [Polyangiaceae bacterium]|jgi:heme/copper-type cytochrome/quinol oxidase subunit 1
MNEVSDVYAPPKAVETEPTGTPRALVAWAAIVAAALFGCSLLCALLLRWSSLSPTGLLSKDSYSLAFVAHMRLAIPFGNALTLLLLSIVSPIDARDRWRQRVFWATTGLVALEALITTALPYRGLPEAVVTGDVRFTFAAVSLCLLWGAVRCLPGIGAAILLAAPLGSWFEGAREDYWFLLCQAALSSRWAADGAAVSFRDRRFPVRRDQLLLLGVPLAFHSRFGSSALSLIWTGVAAWLAVLVWTRMTPPIPLAARVLARGGLGLFALHTLTGAMLRVLSMGTHLNDTLFLAGSGHAAVLGVTLMALAAALRILPEPPVPVRTLRNGMRLWLAGSVGFVLTFCVLGARGNPARYVYYLPEFVELQRIASLSTLALTVGVLLVGFALTRRAPS